MASRLALLTLLGALGLQAGEVMSWIPPYNLQPSREVLRLEPGGVPLQSWLTRIGLQFWQPTRDGGLAFVKHRDPVSDALVAEFRDAAHRKGIKVLLTVYNHDGKEWSWDLAKAGFKTHRRKFIQALVKEMDRQKLDGIDLDLEGNGYMEEDRQAFALFVKELSVAVRARKRLLTVDTFHSPCANAPHMGWWEDWKGQVDAIHVMGYGDLAEGSTETFIPEGKTDPCAGGAPLFKFSWQVDYARKAGWKADQIYLGVPSWSYRWGKGAAEKDLPGHLADLKASGAALCIWDLPAIYGKGKAEGWASAEAWQSLRTFRAPSVSVSAHTQP